jgi:hypothetical protein
MPVAAGVVGDTDYAAIVAGFHMTAERGGATGHDRTHHALFDTAQMPGVSKAINVAMPAQDIGDLNVNPRPVPGHGRSTGRSDLQD